MSHKTYTEKVKCMIDRYILADFDINDPLSEFHSYAGLELDYIPNVPDTPVVDVLAYKTAGKESVSMILCINSRTPKEIAYTPEAWNEDNNIGTLRKLYTQQSRYNDFLKLSKGMNIIIYQSNNMLVTLKQIARQEHDFCQWLNELKPIILSEGIPGDWLKKHYSDCTFVAIGQPYLEKSEWAFPHLHSFKKHQPTKDFLCLMIAKRTAPNRDILNKHLHEKDLIDHCIYSYKENQFSREKRLIDLPQSYSNIVVQGFGAGAETLPPIHYYNQTNVELVAETMNRDDGDDTFLITEKTVKPISMMHPFLVMSNYNFLYHLKQFGFRTFGEHIDESYDSEKDAGKRADIITDNLYRLKGTSIGFYNQTKEIREHNLLTLQHVIGTHKTRLWQILDELWKNL